jgi:hypothetical protein
MRWINTEFKLLLLPVIALVLVPVLGINNPPLVLEASQIQKHGNEVKVNITFRHNKPIWRILQGSGSPTWMQTMFLIDGTGSPYYKMQQRIGSVQALGTNRYKTSGTFDLSNVPVPLNELTLRGEIIMDLHGKRSTLPLSIPLQIMNEGMGT